MRSNGKVKDAQFAPAMLAASSSRSPSMPSAKPRRKPIDQSDRPIGRAQKQTLGAARYRSAIEPGHNLSRFYACKFK
jgi:hypothetical protein